MIFNTADSLSFTNATTSQICTKPLADDDRVRDHCHITGIYRGAGHSACNLNYRINPKSWKRPVVIHNLKGYHGHFIVRALKSEFGIVGLIPQNLEKYLSLSVGQLKFLDSFQFTPKSLDVLSKTLEDDEFKYIVKSCTTSHFDLVRRKGVYPYDYMDSVERFEETELPSQDAFFNKLSGSSYSDTDYAHASRVRMHVGVRQLQTIMMYIYSWMCCCWWISSRNFVVHAWISTVLILYTITLLLVLHGMLHFVCHVLN